MYIFTSKHAFGHSGVQFLMSSLTTCLRTRRFNRPTFRLTRHTDPTHESLRNTAFRDFSNIWRGCIFFLLTFALLHLLSADLTTLKCFSSAFQLSILSEVYCLNFLRLFQYYKVLLRYYFVQKLFSAAFLRSSSQQPSLSSLSQQLLSAALLSSLSQRLFSAALLSSLS